MHAELQLNALRRNMLPASVNRMNTELSDVIDLFEHVNGKEKIELLVEFGDELKPLPARLEELRDRGLYMITECQAPVFLYVEVANGAVAIYADAPREAPIARGFVGVLYRVFDGAAVGRVLNAPHDLVAACGLVGVLSMQRRRGLSAIYNRLVASVAVDRA